MKKVSLFLYRGRYYLSVGSALLITALSQYSFGRLFICKCGYIKLWHGEVWSSENSQHLTDWYTFSHIIHGFGFYFLRRLLRRLTLFQTFLLALALESGWEILENSSFIINRYRETTISLDYFGDSIINCLMDILAMVLGFYVAKKSPLWVIILLAFIMEIGTGILIRDNLFLNILMLLYPIPVVKSWQMGLSR